MDDGRLLENARAAALWYEDNLAGRDTFVYCRDGFDIQIHWSHSQFPHLTGLYYRCGRGDARPVAQSCFYDMLVKGVRLDFKRLGFTNNRGFAELKADVLAAVLDLTKAACVYEITRGVFLLGVGDSAKCLGLIRDARLSTDSREVFRPKSVYNGDVLRSGRFDVTVVHDIEQTVTR